MENTIKIDVITGFLGAGKTTFIKTILESGLFGDEKIVIIENEFGDVSVDNGILSNSSYDVVDISGGCICCSVKHSMVEALVEIARDIKPDRVLVEPSGVFVVEDIRGIIDAPRVSQLYHLNGVYTMVDSQFFLMDMMLRAPFFKSQLTYADHILVTKFVDDHEQLEDVLSKVSQYNQTAKVHTFNSSDYDLETLSSMFDQNKCLLLEGEIEHSHGHQQLESHSFLDTISYTSESFKQLMDDIVAGVYGEVVRLKGYVEIDATSYLVQLVHSQYDLSQVKSDRSYLVIIGENLKSEQLSHSLSKA